MGNFEFKSQVATTREQSQKLLQLGLKESTADCHWFYHLPTETWRIEAQLYFGLGTYRPAWSLHRLLSLLPTEIKCDVENGLGIYLGSQNDVSYFGVLGYYSCENLYDAVILCIEDVINEGYFNKDYLEERK